MADIVLDISDPGLRLTLEVMLQAEGHGIVAEHGEVTIADSPAAALTAATSSQALLLTTLSGVPDAVTAMRGGVYGYVLLPLQPGEVGLMASRAAHARNAGENLRDAAEALVPLAEAEKEHIEKVLRACKGNQVKAARVLGIGRNTLWRKLKSWDTPSPEERGGTS